MLIEYLVEIGSTQQIQVSREFAIRPLRENEGSGIMTYTFDLDGTNVAYEYSRMGSPTSIQYLFLDVTAEYKSNI